MSEWSAHNQSIIKSKLQTFLNEKRKVLVSMLRAEGESVSMSSDRNFSPCPPYQSKEAGTDNYPVWNAQMRDSTGAGLYIDGRTEYFMPPPKGAGHQSSDNYPHPIFGHEMLEEAITQRASQLPIGIHLVLFSAVPYAEKVNKEGSPWGRGSGYFDRFKADFEDSIMQIANYIKSR